ncbi:signal-regulatory protein beta-1-like isoform X6 [Elephas maximus indicus]|uniref:signal-regulatory protein beta-1-like isoform X6 n=1 Tax=Elephas maximus indicus TaxID=99487 RepID=UPI0021169323|nr:signal-regulatory protein beta-1-like isoform X6 [Elephas maximus indicus]
MPVAASQPCLPRPSLMLSLLLGLAGAAGEQELQVTQRETSVSVTAGEAVTLSCVVSSPQPVGPVQWFKGNGPDRQLVYSFKGGLDRVRLFPRVTNVTDQTIRGNTDYSIRIMDMSTEDSGIYYCVKFRKGSPEDVEFKSGPGTLVTVNAKPSPPKVSGPSKRTSPGQVVNLTCTSTGFFPRNISLKWLENGMEIPALQTLVLPPGDASSYTVISTTQVTLTISSLHSQVTCQVAHSELQGLLSGHVTMSQFLQGPRTSSSLYGMVLLLCWKLFSLTVLSTLYIVRRTLPSRPSRVHVDCSNNFLLLWTPPIHLLHRHQTTTRRRWRMSQMTHTLKLQIKQSSL